MKLFRGGLVFKAHRLLYHSTLGWRVIKKKKRLLCKPAAGIEVLGILQHGHTHERECLVFYSMDMHAREMDMHTRERAAGVEVLGCFTAWTYPRRA